MIKQLYNLYNFKYTLNNLYISYIDGYGYKNNQIYSRSQYIPKYICDNALFFTGTDLDTTSHRLIGPAALYTNFMEEYYINRNRVTKELVTVYLKQEIQLLKDRIVHIT